MQFYELIRFLNQNYTVAFFSLILIGLSYILTQHRFKNKANLWESHLMRLHYINYVAIVMFFLSILKLFGEYRIESDSGKIYNLYLAGLGLTMSLTYFFGFLGVSIVSSLLDDNNVDTVANSSDVNSDDIHSVNKIPEIAIVGGGCAGCTLALALARKGKKVVLIERDLSYQDRIVGELLQPGGIRSLERLGLDSCAKENCESVNVYGYVVIDPSESESDASHKKTQGLQRIVKEQILSYPEFDPESPSEYFGILQNKTSSSEDNSGNLNNKSKPIGRSFHHGKFVQNLRQRALNHPNIEVIEGTVTKLLEEKGVVIGVQFRRKSKNDQKVSNDVDSNSSSSKVTAGTETESSKVSVPVESILVPLTMVADGIWSSSRKTLSDTTLTQVSSFVGVIVTHPPMESPVPHPYHGHVILADPSPCLIYQISPTETRVLVDFLGPLPSTSNGEMQTYLINKISPQMPAMFRSAFIKAVEENEIKSMPNRFCPAREPLKRGALLIGDALNMRHPLTGGGMTVAIRDAETLSNLIGSPGFDLTQLHSVEKQYKVFLEKRKAYASTINVLANALHAVFSAPPGNEVRQCLRQACFEYLNLGGVYAAGPIGLLSGLTPKPVVLTTHFFMVAFYGAWRVCFAGFSAASFRKTHNLLRVACSIILPLLASERSTFLSWSWIRGLAFILFPPLVVGQQ